MFDLKKANIGVLSILVKIFTKNSGIKEEYLFWEEIGKSLGRR